MGVTAWNRRTRRLVRDAMAAAQGWRCCYCLRPMTRAGDGASPASEVSLDHVVPRCRGGTDVLDNLVAACRGCNRRKGDREWRPHLGRVDRRGVVAALAVAIAGVDAA